MNIKEIKSHLINDIIPFWKNLRDDESGGFYGEMSYALELNKKADKGGILNSRILWFFSNAYTALGDGDCLDCARHAYEFLKKAFIDAEHGGVYWSVDYAGQPKDDMKHTYNQAFAVYALASYYVASGDKDALGLAYELADVIEFKCRDEAGYLEAFDREFKPIINEHLSENNITAHRTMNTLLHIYEAYTELYRADGAADIAHDLKRILGIFEQKVYNPDKKRLEVFFDHDYNSIIDLCSYGHDIEASWLLDRGTEVLGIPPPGFTKELAAQIHAVALDEDGSVFNECEEGRVDTRKVWWVQAEALLGFLHAGYTETAGGIWEYIKAKVIDPRPGSEWLNELHKDGTPIETKAIADPWKCPYHNGRMCIEVLNRAAE
jgi:mannobiose 2-epimerase